MATVTHAGTATWSTSAGSATTPTATATPAVNDLIVVVAASSGLSGGTTTVTDNNPDGLGTYTQVDTDRTGFSTTGVLTVWVRNALVGSATSTVFTAPQSGSTGGGLDVFRISGMTRTGAGAVRQSAGQSSGTSGTAPAPAMGSAVLTGNPVIGAVCCGTNSSTNFTPRTGYTEATDLGYNTPATGLETMFISSGETASTITWGSNAPSAFASVAIELDTSTPATSPTLEVSSFGGFPGIGPYDTINSVTATILQFSSDAGMAAPAYQLWDGSAAQIGSTATGATSTSSSHTDTVTFTGATFNQLGGLRVRMSVGSGSAASGATVSVDYISLTVNYTPSGLTSTPLVAGPPAQATATVALGSRIVAGSAPSLFPGSATLSGAGSLTAAPVQFTTSALSGAGSLTASPAFTPAAAMTGLGTLTAAPVFAETAALSGTGTLTGHPTAPANAALAGLGTLTAAPAFIETASLSGAGTLTSSPAFTGAAALSGSGTLTESPAFTPAVTLSGSGTLTSAPQVVGTPPSAVISAPMPPRAPPPPRSRIIPATQPQDFVVVVADMQPGPSTTAPPTIVAGDITGLNPKPVAILFPGDCANTGATAEYTNLDSMYGSVKSLIYPVPGNHDWGASPPGGSIANYDTYWGSQARSGNTPPHCYSFDLPTGWHVIAIDSDAQFTGVGSVNNPSSTYSMVAADLAANKGKPLIAFWHHPRFSDGTNTTDPGGTGDTTTVQDIWNLLRDYACDLVFVGHCHSYQRFPKFGKTATADPLGIREFVVGTGGSGLFTLTAAPGAGARSEVNSWQSAAYDQLNSQWFGRLELRLTATTYSWKFISQSGAGTQNPSAVLDSGGPVQTNLSQGASQGSPSATLSGTGSLTASPAFAGTAALSGSGTLTASPAFAGSAALTGTGTLTGSPAQFTTAALSGSGTLTGSPVRPATASLSGSGTLTGTPVLPAIASLSGSGSLTAAPAFTPAAALSGTGTLTAAPAFAGTATLSGSGLLTGAPGVAGIPAIRAVAQPPAPPPPPPPRIVGFTPPATFTRTASLSGSGTLTSSPVLPGGAALSGAGSLAANPAFTATTALSGSGSLTGSPMLPGTAALSGAGTLTANPTAPTGASLSGSGTLASAPVLVATATLAGSGSLTAGPAFAPPTVLSGAGTLGAVPIEGTHAILSGAGTLGAVTTSSIRAALSGSGTLASGPVFTAAVTLSGTGALAAGPLTTAQGSASLAAPGTLGADAAVVKQAAAALSAPGVMTAAFESMLQGEAILGAGPTLTVTAKIRTSDRLWQVYLAAAEEAAAQAQKWRMYRSLVGGSSQTGFQYGVAYQAENAADAAYQAWQEAYRAENPGSAG